MTEDERAPAGARVVSIFKRAERRGTRSAQSERRPDPGWREIASAILIGTCGRILLQQRDNVQGVRFPGKVALFGGHREEDETFLECARREVHEEVGQLLPPDRFEPLIRYTATYPNGGGLIGEFFVVRDVPVERLVVTEGTLLAIEPQELPSVLPRMTPSSCYVAQIFLYRDQ
jgi:8-oxo-dGTP diphosphatase